MKFYLIVLLFIKLLACLKINSFLPLSILSSDLIKIDNLGFPLKKEMLLTLGYSKNISDMQVKTKEIFISLRNIFQNMSIKKFINDDDDDEEEDE